MTELQRRHYKEKTPEETVDILCGILKRLGIQVEEQWVGESLINTFSLRLNFQGTTKGTNGKGVSREYARASAYAEFFERFQNGILINPRYIPKSKNKSNYLIAADERFLTAREIIEQNDPFIQMYFERRNMSNASIEEKEKAFRETNRIDYMVSGVEDQYACLPFYDVVNERVVFLPHWIYCIYYGSNGMSAGNTPSEALVQGLSEIFERVVQKSLFFLKCGLPTVPDDYLRLYPEMYEKYKRLREIPGYTVSVKDCSFGGKFPVVGLLIIQQNTGKYGIKLGCHPDFGIALERTLTEATQGTDILEYVERSSLDFFNTNVTDWVNMTNSYKVGLSQYPYQLLFDDSCYEFVVPEDVSSKTNEQLCRELISKLKEAGFDILIRDVSTLGFPSYHIIIPGLSELIDASDDKIRAYNTRAYASGLIQSPNKIIVDNCKYVIASIGYFSRSLMENGLESYYQDTTGFQLPYCKVGASAIYLAAMCQVMTGNYFEAYKKMALIVNHLNSPEISDSEKALANATMHYLGARANKIDHEKAMEYLGCLYDKATCSVIDDLFQDSNLVIVKQFPSTEKSIDNDTVDRLFYYADILKEQQLLHPIDQTAVAKFLS